MADLRRFNPTAAEYTDLTTCQLFLAILEEDGTLT